MPSKQITFSDADREQLLAFVYNEYNKKMQSPVGKQLAGWWSVARGIGDFSEDTFMNKRFFNLKFRAKWHTVAEDEDGVPAIEVKRWTVLAYTYDFKKEDPFATDPDSETLLFENILLGEKDVEYSYLNNLD